MTPCPVLPRHTTIQVLNKDITYILSSLLSDTVTLIHTNSKWQVSEGIFIT
uniref:Uncharacterized protein n=1 Tax=Anguilla anguilla TaxID=7936 RepID=A0A0E9UVY3_ANGAN